MSRTQFLQLPIEEAKSILPLVLTYNGEAVMLCAKPEDFIFLGDMHPRIKHMLKAMEARARVGMPKDNQVLDNQELKIAFSKQES